MADVDTQFWKRAGAGSGSRAEVALGRVVHEIGDRVPRCVVEPSERGVNVGGWRDIDVLHGALSVFRQGSHAGPTPIMSRGTFNRSDLRRSPVGRCAQAARWKDPETTHTGQRRI